jgi:hypothetical protein
MVAKSGLDAMMQGDGNIVTGPKNQMQSAAAKVTPARVLASQHRRRGLMQRSAGWAKRIVRLSSTREGGSVPTMHGSYSG